MPQTGRGRHTLYGCGRGGRGQPGPADGAHKGSQPYRHRHHPSSPHFQFYRFSFAGEHRRRVGALRQAPCRVGQSGYDCCAGHEKHHERFALDAPVRHGSFHFKSEEKRLHHFRHLRRVPNAGRDTFRSRRRGGRRRASRHGTFADAYCFCGRKNPHPGKRSFRKRNRRTEQAVGCRLGRLRNSYGTKHL